MRVKSVLVLLLAPLLFESCMYTTGTGYNKSFPEKEKYSPDEVATIILAYPFKPQKFDGQGLKEVGEYNTVIEALPGEHTIIVVADTSTNSGGAGSSYQRSDPFPIQVRAQAGWCYILNQDCNGVRRIFPYFSGGPRSIKTSAGNQITINIAANTVVVEKGAQKKIYKISFNNFSYSPDSRHIAFVDLDNGKSTMVRDDAEDEPTDVSLIGFAWSLTGGHFAQRVANKCGLLCLTRYMALDGKLLGPYKYIGDRFFFDVKGQFHYTAERDDGCFYFKGGEAIKMATWQQMDAALAADYEAHIKSLK